MPRLVGGPHLVSRQTQPAALSWVNVRDYGATGDGVTIDTDGIRAAITAAGVGGTLHFRPRETFLIDGELTPLEGQTWIGYGATLKRCNVVSATLTAASSGATVTVDNPAVFRVGMHVSLWDGSDNEISNRKITSIVGNTITTSTSWVRAFAAGATLYSSLSVISGAADGVRIVGLTIDGNRANNTVTAQWENHCEIALSSDRARVRDCYLHDALCEGIQIGGVDVAVEGNVIENAGGNGIHLSGTTGARIVGNSIRNANLAGAAPGHADGGIIASNLVADTLVDGNYIENAIAGIGSWDSSDNSDLTVTNNTIRNCTSYGIEMRLPNGQILGNIVISNNRIYDSGSVQLYQTDNGTPVDIGPRRIVISANYLENTTIFVNYCFGVVVANNQVYFDAADDASRGISIAKGGNILVSGNQTRNGGYGIYHDSATALITGNLIINAHLRGINLYNNAALRGNYIVSDTSVAAAYYGIVLQNGDTAESNTIIATKGAYGILCPNGGAGVQGGIVISNVVKTPAGVPSIRAGGGSVNNIIKGNYVQQAVSDGGAGNTVADNTTILA